MFFYYLVILGYYNMPDFLIRYLNAPSLLRLKKIGNFCGMDYASKDIYKFREYISRFDHSLSVCLHAYSLTHDKETALKALFHDVSTPCFSHVIDYMNKDYRNQESTEEYTEKIISEDTELNRLLTRDNIDAKDIINFKKYSIVDNKRPKLCADRLDGIILTGSMWTKDVDKKCIKDIIDSLEIYINEDSELEIGINNIDVANKLISINDNIDKYCHSKEDNYMMELLAGITKKAIDEEIIDYDDLYRIDETTLLNIFKNNGSISLKKRLDKFYNIKKEDIKDINLPYIKRRNINPICCDKRAL